MYLSYVLYMLSKLVMFPYGMILYPLAFPFRGVIRKNKKLLFFLWVVLDDEEDFGEEFFLRNRKKNFWTSYAWAALRNNCWNYHRLFVYDLVVPNQMQFPVMRFKWMYFDKHGKWIEGWTVNQGDRLSEAYSSIGTHFTEMTLPYRGKAGMKKIFTYSYAGKKGIFLLNIKLGFNSLGEQIFDFKIKLYKKEHTSNWMNPL